MSGLVARQALRGVAGTAGLTLPSTAEKSMISMGKQSARSWSMSARHCSTVFHASSYQASSSSSSSSTSASYTTAHASSSSRSRRRFSSSAHRHAPPPPPPEAAVSKPLNAPPNPLGTPGRVKAVESRSERNEDVNTQQMYSPPPAPSTSSSSSSSSLLDEHTQQATQSGLNRERQRGTSPSSSASDEACATLSPSSPAAPRSQGKEREVTSSSSPPKAIPPEVVNQPSTGAKAPGAARGKFKAQKAAITLTPTALDRLKDLLDTSGRLIRIGVRNKGCAGMSYHLEYVEPKQAGKFDERVKQDGVEVLIDSKALFSIIGSEMDWQEDRLSAKFVFNNPNVIESCGCGESVKFA